MNIKLMKKTVSRINFFGNHFLRKFVFYSGKIVGRLVFPLHLIKNSKEYIFKQSYYPEENLKSKLRIFFEQLCYILKTGELNKNYFIFGFDRKNKNDFKNYVPWLTFTHYRDINNQLPKKPIYDPHNYICLLRDKFVFEAFCKRLVINTPTNIGFIYDNELFLLKENKFIKINEITNYEFDAFCKREVSYGGGFPTNILKLQISENKIFVNKKEIIFNSLIKLLGNDRWIIQERIKDQHPEYAKFHSQSVNTIRIVTIKNNSSIDVLCSFFRIGVNGKHTDNWSSGGMVIGVDINTGKLEKWGLFNPTIGIKSNIHPDSKICFEDVRLYLWDEMVEYVKKVHKLFYGIHSIGWDIAITSNGIMLVEGNDNWDTIDAQFYAGAKMDFNKYFKSQVRY